MYKIFLYYIYFQCYNIYIPLKIVKFIIVYAIKLCFYFGFIVPIFVS